MESGRCWFLQRAMYSRRASAGETKSSTQLSRARCASAQVVPHDFPSRHAWILQFATEMTSLAEGSAAARDHPDRVLGEAFDVKVLPRIGPPGFGGPAAEGVHLGCTIAWKPRGFTWCGNPQEVADFITLMGLTWGLRGPSTPASNELPSERAGLVRNKAVTALYIRHGQAIRAVRTARYHVWHVHANCDAVGEASSPTPVHAAIPRGMLWTTRTDGHRLGSRHGDKEVLCRARANALAATCWTAV